MARAPDGTTETAVVTAGEAGGRLDRFCAARWPERSRTWFQERIRAGDVTVDGQRGRAGASVAPGNVVAVRVVERAPQRLEPEPRDLTILLDDPCFFVVDKPPGLPTHPGPGHSRGSLVNALLALPGPLAPSADPTRPGIVHRLDRDTSGVIVIAKDDQTHRALATQWQARTVEKEYLALVVGVPEHDEFVVDAALQRDPKQRARMRAVPKGTPAGVGPKSRTARTRFRVRERFRGFTLVACFPETGRTHQIRVHLAAHGTPVASDPMYGAERSRLGLALIPRCALHARRLVFAHPQTGAPVEVIAPVPADLEAALAKLRGAALAPPPRMRDTPRRQGGP